MGTSLGKGKAPSSSNSRVMNSYPSRENGSGGRADGVFHRGVYKGERGVIKGKILLLRQVLDLRSWRALAKRT